jgi:hypothetical protein
MEIDQNYKRTWFPAFQKGFCYVVKMFFKLLYVDFFYVKTLLLGDFKSLTKMRIRIGLAPWIRIRIKTHSVPRHWP